MTINIDTIASDIWEFDDLPVKSIKRFIFDGFEDMCRHTWAYTEWLKVFLVAGTPEYTLTPTGNYGILGIPHDGANIGLIKSPEPSASTGTAAGTLVDSTTYSYKVTATVKDYGQTPSSIAVTAAADANGSVDLSWDEVVGADGYKVYGRTADSWLLMSTITSAATVTYTDDGSDTPSGAIPDLGEYVREMDVKNVAYEKGIVSSTWRIRETSSIIDLIFDGVNKVRLAVIPDADADNKALQVKVALFPTKQPTTIPSIFDPYRFALSDYARYKIYTLPKTKKMMWQDQQMANHFHKKYRDKREELKMRIMSGESHSLRARPGFFA